MQVIKCRFGENHKVPKGCKSCIHYDKERKECGKVSLLREPIAAGSTSLEG